MAMMDKYLQQQAASVVGSVPEDSIVQYQDNITLEDFRNIVKKWLEFDNAIKRMQETIREKRKAQEKLSEVITRFMCKYNIEDLNTKEGRIRCKTSVKKTPVNQKVVKQKISDYFGQDNEKKEQILNKIYEDRDKKEIVSLRRLKIT